MKRNKQVDGDGLLYEDSGTEPLGPRAGAALSFVGQLVRCPEGLHQGCPRAWPHLTEAWPDAPGPVQRGACPPGLLLRSSTPGSIRAREKGACKVTRGHTGIRAACCWLPTVLRR